MSIGPLNNVSSDYLQSILSTQLQSAGLSTNKTKASSLTQQPDNGQLSPFAQLMNTLQQLQQSDPTKYQQVTQQIATNLQAAAKTAQSDGNTTAANQLTQLANDFTTASQSGQLPSIQDLAQAAGGHHHHHHHGHAASPDSGSNSTDNSSSNSTSTGTNQALSQILSAFQSNSTQSDALNPMAIILNTLSNAGITGTNS